MTGRALSFMACRVYFSGSTIVENNVFGISTDKTDHERVRQANKLADVVKYGWNSMEPVWVGAAFV